MSFSRVALAVLLVGCYSEVPCEGVEVDNICLLPCTYQDECPEYGTCINYKDEGGVCSWTCDTDADCWDGWRCYVSFYENICWPEVK